MQRQDYQHELLVDAAEAWARRLRRWWHQTGDYHVKVCAFVITVLKDPLRPLYREALAAVCEEGVFLQLAKFPKETLKELPNDEATAMLITFAEALEAFVARERAKEKADAEAD